MSEDAFTAAKPESCGYDDEAVAAYLLKHPDFLGRHPEILAALETERRADGAVSFVEKQLSVLRKQNSDTEAHRAELIETARVNANLSVCLHKIAVELLRDTALDRVRLSRSGKAGRIFRSCRMVLQERIPDVHFSICWFEKFFEDGRDPDGVAVIDEKDQRITSLVESLFMAGNPGCGPFSKPECIVLFGRSVSSVRSAVVAPLVEPVTNDRMGILVLASDDAARFAPGKGTMFLVQLVQLIECAFSPARGAQP